MSKILVIARLSWEENVRKKVFYLLLFLAALVVVGGRFVQIFGLEAHSRLLRDFGLTGIGIFALLFTFALFLNAVPSEIERKTIYPILAKPITRGEYLWGKFLGNLAILFIYLLVLAALLALTLYSLTGYWFPMVFWAVALTFIECGVVGSIILFFSLYFSYPITLSLTLLVYFIGNLSSVYQKVILTKDVNLATRLLVQGFKPLFPQFNLFHIKNAVVHNYILDPHYLPYTMLYGVLYAILFMLLSEFVFQKKEL